jgi:hypothetical protein
MRKAITLLVGNTRNGVALGIIGSGITILPFTAIPLLVRVIVAIVFFIGGLLLLDTVAHLENRREG